MSVKYRGPEPTRKFTVSDFYKNGIIITMFLKWKDHEGKRMLRCVFRSNGLLGEIRRTCDGVHFAVDVEDDSLYRGNQQCLTTECKTVGEAKSILFMWFQKKGFSLPEHRKATLVADLRMSYTQLSLSPFIFRY